MPFDPRLGAGPDPCSLEAPAAGGQENLALDPATGRAGGGPTRTCRPRISGSRRVPRGTAFTMLLSPGSTAPPPTVSTAPNSTRPPAPTLTSPHRAVRSPMSLPTRAFRGRPLTAWAYRKGLAWKQALADLGATGKLTPLPASYQRQGRTLQPHPRRRIGLPPALRLQPREDSGPGRLPPRVQPPAQPHRTRRPAPDQPSEQPCGSIHLSWVRRSGAVTVVAIWGSSTSERHLGFVSFRCLHRPERPSYPTASREGETLPTAGHIERIQSKHVRPFTPVFGLAAVNAGAISLAAAHPSHRRAVRRQQRQGAAFADPPLAGLASQHHSWWRTPASCWAGVSCSRRSPSIDLRAAPRRKSGSTVRCLPSSTRSASPPYSA